MKSRIKALRCFSLHCLALSGSVFAGGMGAVVAPVANPSHFEVLGAVGIANLIADDSKLNCG